MDVVESTLLRDFAIICATAAVALFLCRVLRQPSVLGFLGAGLLLNPGWISSFSVIKTESIREIADLGLVILLFALGIEFGWDRIRRIGARVLFIAGIEITFMLWTGYMLGQALGWDSTESIFLGAAMCISSSAVLSRLLRDSGQLSERRGQIIIGILVVEDFAAVVLLSVLTGVATTGVSDRAQVLQLGTELAFFAVVALVVGTLLVPRIFAVVEKVGSAELLLLAGLGMCFGLALVAEELKLSAAAGAFLIGTVVGDSSHSHVIERVTAPVRDLFGAIFFVSIGVLVDFGDLSAVIVPALVVLGVFMAGKMVLNTITTFLTGEGPRTAVQVGAGMPQMGEFSLAMAKVGADRGAIGAAVSPVITLVTLGSTFIVPFMYRAADPLSDFASRRAPALLKSYFYALTRALDAARGAVSVKGSADSELGRLTRRVIVNAGLMAVIVACGALALWFADEVAGTLEVARVTVALIISGLVAVLCTPSALVISSTSGEMGERLAFRLVGLLPEGGGRTRAEALARVIRMSIRAVLILAAVLLLLPFMLSLFAVSVVVWPGVILAVLFLGYLMFRTSRRIHRELEVAFRRTIMGD